MRRSSARSRQSSQQPHERELFLASSLGNSSDVSSTICLLNYICMKDSKWKSPCESLLTLLVTIIKCCLKQQRSSVICSAAKRSLKPCLTLRAEGKTKSKSRHALPILCHDRKMPSSWALGNTFVFNFFLFLENL